MSILARIFNVNPNHEGNNKTNPECGTFYKITGLDVKNGNVMGSLKKKV